MKDKKEFTALTKCFLCGGSNEILIHKNMRDISDLHGKVVTKEPCNECKKYMEEGVILISIKEGESGKENPFRTGGWVVLKEESLKDIPLIEPIIKARIGFIGDDMWEQFGLPLTDYQKSLGYGKK